jgi:hypothetical protein
VLAMQSEIEELREEMGEMAKGLKALKRSFRQEDLQPQWQYRERCVTSALSAPLYAAVSRYGAKVAADDKYSRMLPA